MVKEAGKGFSLHMRAQSRHTRSLKKPLFRSHPIIEVFYCKKGNGLRLRGSNPFLPRENALCFRSLVTCSTFGGKLVRIAKSRQHIIQVAIVWIAWAYKEKFSVEWFPSVFMERSCWQEGDWQRKFWACVCWETKWWRVSLCEEASLPTWALDTFILKGSSNPEIAVSQKYCGSESCLWKSSFHDARLCVFWFYMFQPEG